MTGHGAAARDDDAALRAELGTMRAENDRLAAELVAVKAALADSVDRADITATAHRIEALTSMVDGCYQVLRQSDPAEAALGITAGVLGTIVLDLNRALRR